MLLRPICLCCVVALLAPGVALLPGCAEPVPDSTLHPAQEAAHRFLLALEQRQIETAIGLCAPDQREAIGAAIREFPAQATSFIASQPELTGIFREKAESELARWFSNHGMIAAHKLHEPHQIGPGRCVVPADLVVPDFFRVATARMDRRDIPETTPRFELIRSKDELPLPIRLPMQEIDGTWYVAEFFGGRMLDPQRSPAYAAHAAMGALLARDRDRFLSICQPEVAAQIREAFGNWLQRNADYITGTIVPDMEAMPPSPDPATQQQLEAAIEQANEIAGMMTGWTDVIIVSDYIVSGVRQAGPSTWVVCVQARMPSFAPHKTNNDGVFEWSFELRPLYLMLEPDAERRWVISENPFDFEGWKRMNTIWTRLDDRDRQAREAVGGASN